MTSASESNYEAGPNITLTTNLTMRQRRGVVLQDILAFLLICKEAWGINVRVNKGRKIQWGKTLIKTRNNTKTGFTLPKKE